MREKTSSELKAAGIDPPAGGGLGTTSLELCGGSGGRRRLQSPGGQREYTVALLSLCSLLASSEEATGVYSLFRQ